MKARCAVLVAAALVAAAADRAECGTRSITIQDTAVIESPEGYHRVLLALEPLTGFDRAVITEAWLEIPLAIVQGVERPLELQVAPIVTPWNAASVDWETGWETPGGDLDAVLYSRDTARVELAGRTLRINLSVMLREAIRHGRTFHGLSVTTPPHRAEGFTTTEMVRLGNLANWAVTVKYQRVEKWPPKAGRGIG